MVSGPVGLALQLSKFIFRSFSYYSFENTVTNFEKKNMLRKESLNYKENFKRSVSVLFAVPVYSVVQTLLPVFK